MANPRYVTFSTTAVGQSINMDRLQTPFNAFISVTGSSSGTFTYGVEYTLQDQQYLTAIGSTIGVTWLPDPNLTAGQTANGTTTYGFPVAAVRCTVSALSGATVLFSVLQGNT